MIHIDPYHTSVQKVHTTLLGSIAPRPIAFASTIDKDGKPNLSPFSFFNAFGVNPTTLVFSPSRRGRNNTVKHTYENLKEVPEVVINVVNYALVEQTSLASTEYPKGINEFIKAGLTPISSEKVRPFRVKESPVQFECKVRQIIETGNLGGAANLVICEILLIHLDESILDENGNIDPNKIDLVGRMGGDFYCRASGNSIFTVKKPVEKIGIGIDSLPDSIRLSQYLSGNDLGKLGNIERLPSDQEVNEYIKNENISGNLSYFSNQPDEKLMQCHLLAKKLLEENKVWEALMVLMGKNK
jgi:flavin reductase (DIM6/NTAB) family NADH-FMN oxidoreductase RutF